MDEQPDSEDEASVEADPVEPDPAREEQQAHWEAEADASEGGARLNALIQAASFASGDDAVRLYLDAVKEAPGHLCLLESRTYSGCTF